MTDVPQAGPTCPLSDLVRQGRAMEFGEYWRNNYPDGCVIASAAWHRPKFERVVERLLAEHETAVVAAERARLREALEQVTQGSDAAWARHAVRSFDEACEYVDATTRRA